MLCVCFWPFRRLEEDLSSLELKLKAIVTHSTWFWAPNMGKNSTCLNGHLSTSFIGCFFFFTLKVIPRRCQLLRIHRRLPRWLRYRLTAVVPSALDYKNWGKQAIFLWWHPSCQFPSFPASGAQIIPMCHVAVLAGLQHWPGWSHRGWCLDLGSYKQHKLLIHPKRWRLSFIW